MCVERTASTKVPSARASRDTVACQYRAAMRAGTLDWGCGFFRLMIIGQNLAHRGKTIYPRTAIKAKTFVGAVRLPPLQESPPQFARVPDGARVWPVIPPSP